MVTSRNTTDQSYATQGFKLNAVNELNIAPLHLLAFLLTSVYIYRVFTSTKRNNIIFTSSVCHGILVFSLDNIINIINIL